MASICAECLNANCFLSLEEARQGYEAWRRNYNEVSSYSAIAAISRRRVARELSELIERRDKRGMIFSDNGTRFTSKAMLSWAQDNRIFGHFIAPGRPMQNAFCKSFNGRMRDDPHNESRFLVLDPDHARTKIASSIDDDNQRWPHSALGYLTSVAYVANLSARCVRLRNPDQFRRSHIAPPAPHGVDKAEALNTHG